MAAFIFRQLCLQDRLQRLSDGEGLLEPYNGYPSIEELHQLLQEAEACFELYDQFDNGDSSAEILELREKRRLAGLSIDPMPSTIKCRAWTHLTVARHHLAKAYYKSGDFESALALYHLLVDQCRRMRTETWDENSMVPLVMHKLAICYKHLGQLESAREWLEKAMRFCERDGLVELHQKLKVHFAQLAGTKAGPMASGDVADNKKIWKRCWWCEKEETKDLKLSRCAKCVSLKLATPAYYCSRKCQKQDWPRHKDYHKKIKEGREHSSEFSPMSAEETRIQQEHKGDEYAELLFQSRQAQIDGDQKKARRLLEKAIKVDPKNPSAYNNLAVIFSFCHNYQGKIKCQLEVMRIVDGGRGKEGCNMDLEVMWANAAVSIFSTCYQNAASTSLLDNKPDWILDPEKQLKVAKRACSATPDHFGCWIMRADALEKMGELNKAIQQLSVAKEDMAKPEDQAAIDNMIECIQQKQQQQE